MKGIRLLRLSQLLSPKPTRRDIAPFRGIRFKTAQKTERNWNDGLTESESSSGSNEQAFVVIIYYQVASAVSIGAALAAIWAASPANASRSVENGLKNDFLNIGASFSRHLDCISPAFARVLAISLL